MFLPEFSIEVDNDEGADDDCSQAADCEPDGRTMEFKHMYPPDHLIGDLGGRDGFLLSRALLLCPRAAHSSSLSMSRSPRTQVRAALSEQMRMMRSSMTMMVKVSDGSNVHLGGSRGSRSISRVVSQEEVLGPL